MIENIYSTPGFWSKTGPNADIVLSTRIRLARNLASIPFPHSQGENEINIIKAISGRFVHESIYDDHSMLIDVQSLADDDKRFLRERNIITSEMESSTNSLVIFNHADNFVIMVNEEDHFRIQVINPGFQIMEGYRLADRIDDELNKFVSYSFSDEFGYLTSCPSNIGTGLKVSAMVHLPVLTLMKSIPNVVSVVNKFGSDMSGTTGDDQKIVGCMYLVSNHASLGKSEVDILEEMDEVINMIVDMESEARDDFLSKNTRMLEDRIYRSYGIVQNSRLMTYMESIEQLSNLRLGVILSVIKNIELEKINDLMVNVQSSHLQKSANRSFSSDMQRDEYRADFLRKQFH